MKKYNVFFNEFVKGEIFEIFEKYEFTKEGLGERFLEEFEKIVFYLENNPYSFRKVYIDFRRIFTEIFPYHIYYKIYEQKEEVEIFLVIYTGMNPKKAINILKNTKQ